MIANDIRVGFLLQIHPRTSNYSHAAVYDRHYKYKSDLKDRLNRRWTVGQYDVLQDTEYDGTLFADIGGGLELLLHAAFLVELILCFAHRVY